MSTKDLNFHFCHISDLKKERKKTNVFAGENFYSLGIYHLYRMFSRKCVYKMDNISDQILTPLKSAVKSWHPIYCHNLHLQKKIVMTNEFYSTFYNYIVQEAVSFLASIFVFFIHRPYIFNSENVMITNLLLILHLIRKQIHFVQTSEVSISDFGAKLTHLNPSHGNGNTYIPLPRLMVTAVASFSLRSLLPIICRRIFHLHHDSSQSDTRHVWTFLGVCLAAHVDAALLCGLILLCNCRRER